jgi:hypothetical protein
MTDIELLLGDIHPAKLCGTIHSDEWRKRQSEMMKRLHREGVVTNKGGYTQSAEAIQNMSAGQKKRWTNDTERKAAVSKRARAMAKPFHTPFGVFSSVREASEVLGIKYATLYSRLYSMSDRYYLGSAE